MIVGEGGGAVTRIAALIPANGVSGPARQLIALADALQRAGTEVLVIVLHRRGRPASAFAQYLRDAGIQHCVMEDAGPADWRMASRVATTLRSWRPSIVQTHGYKATAVAYLLRGLQRRPWHWIGFHHGVTTEDVKDRFYHWVDRQLLRAADRVVVMSQAQARAFKHCDDRVRIIYNAVVPPPRGDPTEGDRGVVFSALVAGDGPDRAVLEARCARLGLAPSVRFLGQVGNVGAVYGNLDLVVLPSRSEGLPNTLLEAMQADVPVVATAVGAVPEVVGTSAAARLVAPESAGALADAIERAITQGDSPAAAAARRDVVSRFSLERRLEAHLKLYRELLEAQAGVTPVCVALPAQ
jgi:Glycosyl transferases group 1